MITKVVGAALSTVFISITACRLSSVKLAVEQGVESKTLIAEAPYIVIGTIASNAMIGHEVLPNTKSASSPQSEAIHRFRIPYDRLQLFRVKVNVENVLRGTTKDQDVEIYYYTYVGPIGGPLGFGMRGYGGRWEIGDREIFYFKKIGNVFRMFCDFYDSCVTPVFSGAHPGFTIDSTRPPAESIVDLLLTRGEGGTDEGMVKAVLSRSAEYFAEPYAIRKWRDIAEHDESALVRDAACSQLKKEELPCPSYKGTLAQKQGS
jgi:hypothetical protein